MVYEDLGTRNMISYIMYRVGYGQQDSVFSLGFLWCPVHIVVDKKLAWLGTWSSVDPASICHVGTTIAPQTILLCSPVRESLRVLAFHEVRLVKSLISSFF